jgi:group II intron reverse transcriptase/maturase
MEEREMRKTNIVIGIHQDRGSKGLPLERVYRHLFNPELFLTAYGKIYRNAGAMTKGSTDETVDGMSLLKIHQIIALLKLERYRWTPVRRTEIPKEKGGTRPLGIPTWGDKLVQEALRSLIEPYYELRFSNRSHGFRPKRSCHSALREVQRTWKGTVWFIEGDVTKCFDSFDHEVMLSIIRRDIHDGRVITLIDGLLRAGYMEDWRYHETLAGTPQGGIISPLLSNIYLTELDRFVEDTLIPEYTVGKHKQLNEEYRLLDVDIGRERRHGNFDEVKRLKRERRKLPSGDPCDPNYRRLRYIRYADDFLLGFVGPKKEAEDIRERLREFLASQLKCTRPADHVLDEESTLQGSPAPLEVPRCPNTPSVHRVLVQPRGSCGANDSNASVPRVCPSSPSAKPKASVPTPFTTGSGCSLPPLRHPPPPGSCPFDCNPPAPPSKSSCRLDRPCVCHTAATSTSSAPSSLLWGTSHAEPLPCCQTLVVP